MGGQLLFRISSNLKINDLGKEIAISKTMISILGIVGEMEKVQIKGRQFEGINIAN